ncbi:MAG: glycosyltransferase family 39 protein [Ignavibacteriales bacterium]|nr:glycosyltransferase family 39 protein [Ignavibacteriales bacterium]
MISIIVIAMIWHKIGDYSVETDFYWTYAPQAAKLSSGELTIDDFKGPGYTILLSIVNLLTADYFIAGIFISAISAGIVLIMLYKLLAKYFSYDVSLLVVLMTIANKIFVQYSYTASTDMVFYALIMISIYVFWSNQKLSGNRFAFCGALSGFTYLVRYNGVFLLFVFVFLILLMNIFNESIKKRLYYILFFISGYLSVVLPWSLLLYINTGDMFYQKNYLNIAFELYGKRYFSWDDWWTQESYKYKSFAGVIFHEPLTFFKVSLMNVYYHLLDDLVFLIDYWIGLFSLLAIIMLKIFKLEKKQLAIIIFGVAYFTSLLPVFYAERFTLPLMSIYFLLAVIFFAWVVSKKFKIMNHTIILAIISILLLLSAFYTVYYNAGQIVLGPKDVLNISSDFYKNFSSSEKGKVIIARKPQIAYQLQMKFEQFPNVTDINQLVSEIRKKRVDYLYFSSIEAKMRPQFKKIFRGDAAPPGFELVAISKNPVALLYKINLDRLLIE